MKSSVVAQLHCDFEALVQTEEDTCIEFWMARDLQPLLGYAQWKNFVQVIEKAKTACMVAGCDQQESLAGDVDWLRVGIVTRPHQIERVHRIRLAAAREIFPEITLAEDNMAVEF